MGNQNRFLKIAFIFGTVFTVQATFSQTCDQQIQALNGVCTDDCYNKVHHAASQGDTLANSANSVGNGETMTDSVPNNDNTVSGAATTAGSYNTSASMAYSYAAQSAGQCQPVSEQQTAQCADNRGQAARCLTTLANQQTTKAQNMNNLVNGANAQNGASNNIQQAMACGTGYTLVAGNCEPNYFLGGKKNPLVPN